MKKRFSKLKEAISQKEEEKKKKETSLEDLKAAGKQLQVEIAKLAHTQDRALAEQRSCKKKIETLRANKDTVGLVEAENELKALGEKARGVDEPLGKLMDQQDQVTDKISALQQQISEVQGAIETLQSELQALIDESKKNVGIPAIQVYNQIFLGTQVEGLHSSMIVKENTLRVQIKEAKVNHPEGRETFEWEMRISDI
jgi:chromosome segregation ATPase